MSVFDAYSVLTYFSTKDGELNRERFDLEKSRRELEMKVVQLETDLEAQRNELTTGVYVVSAVCVNTHGIVLLQ